MADNHTNDADKSRPPLWVFVGSAVLSIGYLISEVVFNVVLLDVAGSVSSTDEIEQVELFGRLLSSIGFGLLIGRWIYRRTMKEAGRDAITIAFSAMVISACAFGTAQHFGIKAFSQSRSIDDQMDAYMLMTLKQGIARNHVTINGLEYLNEHIDKPESKALLTLFGPLVYSNTELRETLKAKDQHYVSTIAEQEHAKHVARIYNAYVEASNKRADLARLYAEVESKIVTRANEEANTAYSQLWEQHTKTRRSVRRHTLSGTRYYKTLDNKFWRATGVSLPSEPWTLDQKSAFIRHFVSKKLTVDVLDSALNNAATNIDSQFNFNLGIHPDLRYAMSGREFVATQYAQAPLHAALLQQPDIDLFLVADLDMSNGLRDRSRSTQTRISIPWGLQYDEFAKHTKIIFLNNLQAAHTENLNAIRSTLDDATSKVGARYIEALWVPAVALCLSMMMIVLNLYSLVVMLVRYPFSHNLNKTVRWSGFIVGHGAAVTVCTLLLLAPYSHEHVLTGNATYQAVLTRTAEVAPWPARIMDWTLRAEPLLFTVGEPIIHSRRSFSLFDDFGTGQSDVFVL
ncbi:hypothetical protein [Marinobacterium sp. BA1]|uniref:hypothetical protein n=1 Tax=Marinobacterium sp. BA1 TaxID=3138931 RepID=UPI0032E64345